MVIFRILDHIDERFLPTVVVSKGRYVPLRTY